MAKAQSPIPEGFHTVTPQLTLDNAAEAIEWYRRALGAEEKGRFEGPDGKIMHAELRIGNSRVMLHDAMMGGKGPKALGGSPASLWIYVEDCDALFNRAIAGQPLPKRVSHRSRSAVPLPSLVSQPARPRDRGGQVGSVRTSVASVH